jgi:vitamin B12 transporter
MYKQAALILLALAAVASLAAAQDTTLAVEQIVVTATRIAGTILASPDHVTVVSGEELVGAVSAADALERAAGVSVADNGAVGAVQSISLRGSAAAQVLVLVDGIRLNDSRQGAPDLSQIPVDNIERIEIVRGGTSALYGADAVAGVVNIITKDKAEDRFRLSLTNGSYLPRDAAVWDGAVQIPVEANYLDLVDTQKIGVQLSQEMGAAVLLLTGSFTRANNGYVWYDDQAIDGYRRQDNASLLEAGATMSLSAPAGQGRTGLKVQVGYANSGVPGSVTYVTTDEQQVSSLQAQAFFQTPQLGSSPLSLDARLFYKYSGLSFQSYVEDTHRLNTVGLDLSQKLAAADWLQLVYGGNLLFDAVDSTSVGSKTRLSGGVFLEVPFYLGMLTLTPMARYDLYSDFPDSLTYKLAAVLAVSDSVSLKASAARSYRAPTMNDMYWPYEEFSSPVDIPPDPPYTYTSITTGNPNLRPETGFTGDLGLSVVTGRIEANLFAFVRYVMDGIQWQDQDPDFKTDYFLPVNVGEGLFPGAEADLTLQLLPSLRLSGSYTFLYSFVLEGASAAYSFKDDKRAIYSPVHKADLALSFETGRTRLAADIGYVGERFADEANANRLEPYVLLNAEVRQALNDHLSLTLTGKNLLNQVYQTAYGYPMPPLSIWVGADLRL